MIPIFDGHNDSLPRFVTKDDGRTSFLERNTVGDIDLPRALEANLIGGLFAIFTPNSKEYDLPTKNRQKGEMPAIAPEYAYQDAWKIIQLCKNLLEHPDIFLIENADDLQKCQPQKLGILLHMEGAEAIIKLDTLQEFYAAGLRSLGFVWSRRNRYGYGVPFSFPSSPDTGPGLTQNGKDLLRLCNEIGIMVDVSHLNEKGFWDVVQISQKPIVATHSAVHALCPSGRNLLDTQLQAIAESNGVVGINFGLMFTRPDGKYSVDAPLSVIVPHICYVIEKIGIQHVALGSDFDGACISSELADVTKLPLLLEALRQQGCSSDDLRKIAYENWFRVLQETL